MKNILFCALSALVLFAGCKKDDPKPEPEPVLKAMSIKKITVLGFPSLDNGVAWDPFGGSPDIFLEYSNHNTPFYSTSYYQDATNNNSYVWTDFVYMDHPDALYSIALYDFDDALNFPHDLMGRVSFYIKDQDTDATSLVFNDGPLQFKVDVEFYFDPQ